MKDYNEQTVNELVQILLETESPEFKAAESKIKHAKKKLKELFEKQPGVISTDSVEVALTEKPTTKVDTDKIIEKMGLSNYEDCKYQAFNTYLSYKLRGE